MELVNNILPVDILAPGSSQTHIMERATPEDSGNLIIEQNIDNYSINLVDEVKMTSDLCGNLATDEHLSVIDDVSGLSMKEDVWAATSQDLALSGYYIYQCHDNVIKVTTEPVVNVPSKPDYSHICEFPGCGRGFTTTGYLKIHQLIHKTEKLLTCPYNCGKTFIWPAHLQYHQMTHTGKRAHVCNYEGCGRSFYTNQRLLVHMRLHTGEKPFQCAVEGCLKAFTTAGNLKNHIRTHSGEKPFMCHFEGCTKSFAEQSSLRKHKIIHSGKKPYLCEDCGQQFTQSGSRNVHIRKHHMKTVINPVVKVPTGSVTQVSESAETAESIVTMATATSPLTVAGEEVPGGWATEMEPGTEAEMLTSESPTLIIMTGGADVQNTEFDLDQVVTVSTQPQSYYQDTLELADTLLSHGVPDHVTGKVKVETEISNSDIFASADVNKYL